jgi:hypothetical protein
VNSLIWIEDSEKERFEDHGRLYQNAKQLLQSPEEFQEPSGQAMHFTDYASGAWGLPMSGLGSS